MNSTAFSPNRAPRKKSETQATRALRRVMDGWQAAGESSVAVSRALERGVAAFEPQLVRSVLAIVVDAQHHFCRRLGSGVAVGLLAREALVGLC